MKNLNKRTLIIAVSTLIVGILLGWVLFGGSASTHNHELDHSTESANKETVWTCSMHPQIRQNEPGQCPICGMDLIPLEDEDDDGADPAVISMSAAALQLAGVSTTFVEKSQPVKRIRLNGKVLADERLMTSQSSHLSGRIEKLLVNFTGEYVRKGEPIATIYSPDMVTAQEELFEANKTKETQPHLFNSAKEKLKNWKLSDQQIEEILEKKETQGVFSIRADVSGYVTKKMINPGDYITRGETLFEIANLSKVWILFDVYEADMNWIKKGNPITFTVSSLPGKSFEGKLTYIDPVINPTTRVAKARLELQNSEGILKPEMYVTGWVEAELSEFPSALIVPKSAVMWTGERSVVYIKSVTDNRTGFLMREVTLGPSLGKSYVVLEGLEEGEEIASHGTFSIDAAAQLAGKPSMMGHERNGESDENYSHSAFDSHDPVSINNQAKKALEPVVTNYFKLKDALVGDDLTAAQKTSVEMAKIVSQVDMHLFKGDAHDMWMDYSKIFSDQLEHMHHFNDIEEVRKHFQPISDAIIAMAQNFGSLNDKTVYVQFCPMAFDDKGAFWISSESEIRNPYFGSSMLTCGEVTDEIK